MNEAIKVSSLTKSYRTHTVLKGLDFCVQQREIFALLGINGAGKTTSFECIEGLRKYDSGNVTINGIMGIQLKNRIINYQPGKNFYAFYYYFYTFCHAFRNYVSCGTASKGV